MRFSIEVTDDNGNIGEFYIRSDGFDLNFDGYDSETIYLSKNCENQEIIAFLETTLDFLKK